MAENLSFDFDAPPPPPRDEEPRVWSVADALRALRVTLDALCAPFWLVEGEVSGTKVSSSGHIYFNLKDALEDASLSCVMYRTSIAKSAREILQDGKRVRIRAKPSLWAPRGQLQFVADRVTLSGQGALLLALEKLKAKLLSEGLFDPARKRSLPKEPRIIGVVTSRTGAVIHDICRVAFRRGGANILLAPAQVQGTTAPSSIVSALAKLQRVSEVDVIIVGRGGGSADDLAAFNDEAVVRAVAACSVPIVSAVGHDVDVALTDLAADARAATPSQAAEICVPDLRAQRERSLHLQLRLHRAVDANLVRKGRKLLRAREVLKDPRHVLYAHHEQLSERQDRLIDSIRQKLAAANAAHRGVERRFLETDPKVRLVRARAAVSSLEGRVRRAGEKLVLTRSIGHVRLIEKLDALSPLKILARGYAVVTNAEGRPLHDASDVREGDTIGVRLERGAVSARIERSRGA